MTCIMKKRFLVTGGCGFIGSHLVELLTSSGHSVVVVDDLSSGKKGNLDRCEGEIEVITSKVELCDLERLGELDGVFHLAAQTSVPYSVSNFFESSYANLTSTIKVIDLCARFKVPLVFASSSAVYGNLPLGKEQSEVDILSPYAADKLVGEIYATMAHRVYSLRSYGLRFFNVYGPRQDPTNPYSGVISIFADRLLRGLPIVVNGGYQTRDFIYVKDVVNGIFRAYEYLLHKDVAACSNLLTGYSISIDELVRKLSILIGVSPEITYRDLPFGDPSVSLGSKECMVDNLKMGKFTGLTEGLKLTLEALR